MLSSKLSAFCDKVIEAGWLAAVIATPLFFNVYSSRVFEPDKLTLLRTIASVMAAAWIVKWIEQRNAPRPENSPRLRSALVLPTLIVAAVYILTTITSITPYVSFFGSYQRLQGTYTTLSYIVVFLMILQGLRTRQQLDRLILTIILTSLPIAFYGLLQRYHRDPLPWGGDVTLRVASNMGNAIFVAAYLIMAFFLTVGKITESFWTILTEEEAYAADIVRAAAYVLIAALQAICIVFSQSRGPWLGWFAGMFLFILLVVAVWIQRTLSRLENAENTNSERIRRAQRSLTIARVVVFVTIALGVAGMASIVIINQPNSPLAHLRNIPYFGRLGSLLESESGTGKVRTLIWEGDTQLVPPHAPLQFPDGSVDKLNFLRPLIGYGPESMYVAYNRFYPPDLAHYEARNASPDRSHNETWDSLVITGLIGLLAYQFLFISFFTYGLRWSGLMPTNFERNLFIGLWTVLGILGGAITIIIRDPKYFGVGVPIGIMLGIIGYLILASIVMVTTTRLFGHKQIELPPLKAQILIVALLAGVLAHYIEIHFGIAIASTRTMFWVFAGMLVVIGSGWVDVEEPALAATSAGRPQAPQPAAPAALNVPRNKKRRQVQRVPESAQTTARPGSSSLPAWVGAVIGSAMMTAIILSTMFYEFTTNSQRFQDPFTVIAKALTTITVVAPNQAPVIQTSLGVLGMFLLVWLIGTAIVISEMVRARLFKKADDWIPAAALFASMSMGIALVFALGLSSQLVSLATTSVSRIEEVVGISDRIVGVYNYYYLAFFTLLVLAAVFLTMEKNRPADWFAAGWWGLVAAIPLIIVVYVWINFSNLDPIRADIIYKQADPYDRSNQFDISIAHYKHAINIAPNEDFYYLWLGRAYLEKAKLAKTTTPNLYNDKIQLEPIMNLDVVKTASLSRADLMYAARAVLLRARAINPLNTDHSANLARLYRSWVDLATDQAQRTQLADQSAEYYQEATMLSPNNAALWNEWGTIEMVRGDMTSALAKLNHSVELDDEFDQTYWYLGNAYLEKYNQDQAADSKKDDLIKAEGAFTTSLKLNPDMVQAQASLAYVLGLLGKIPEAIAANQRLLDMTPKDPNQWNTHKNLALLYSQSGDLAMAINEAQIAASTAPTQPTNTRQQLMDYAAQLRAQMAAPPPPVTSTSSVTK